jgi:hypothetical protein
LLVGGVDPLSINRLAGAAADFEYIIEKMLYYGAVVLLFITEGILNE